LTTDDLRAVAHRIVERMVQDHPDAASEISALVPTEVLAACLFGGRRRARIAIACRAGSPVVRVHPGIPDV